MIFVTNPLPKRKNGLIKIKYIDHYTQLRPVGGGAKNVPVSPAEKMRASHETFSPENCPLFLPTAGRAALGARPAIRHLRPSDAGALNRRSLCLGVHQFPLILR